MDAHGWIGWRAEVPIQNGYRWIDDTEYGVVMSAWDSTPATSEMLPFFQHELMLVVDGSVTIIEPDGRETTVRAGGCFVFRRAASASGSRLPSIFESSR